MKRPVAVIGILTPATHPLFLNPVVGEKAFIQIFEEAKGDFCFVNMGHGMYVAAEVYFEEVKWIPLFSVNAKELAYQ